MRSLARGRARTPGAASQPERSWFDRAGLALPMRPLAAPSELDDPVLRLIVDRAVTGSQPGARCDRARLALAIEGGGMAGTVSGGMCAALEALGLIDSFDVIVGSSAGSINASYTAAGQAQLRAPLYLAAAQGGVIRPSRALNGNPPFRLAELFTALFCSHPHAPKVLGHAPALRVTASRVSDKRLAVLSGFASVAEVRTAVWASCAIPVLAGDVVEFRGEQYVDGGLLESMPYQAALRDGASHVLVLRSRPAGYRKREFRGARRQVVERMLRGAPDTVLELVRERPARYNAEADDLQAPVRSGLAGRVCQIAPAATAPRPSLIEARQSRLLTAIATGVNAIYRTLTTGSLIQELPGEHAA
jgi:predicted patatin/cPLA2 family phospholipase